MVSAHARRVRECATIVRNFGILRMCNAISKCPLYGVTGCPLFRGCLSIEVNGRAVGTFRIVCYIMGVHYSGVSVKRGSTVENSESWQLVGGLSCQRSDHRATTTRQSPALTNLQHHCRYLSVYQVSTNSY